MYAQTHTYMHTCNIIIRDPDIPPHFHPSFPQSWSVSQAVGSDNCYEYNFYVSIALLSSLPTSIYTKNVFHQIIVPTFWSMSLLCSVCHIFNTQRRSFSSIQLLVNEKFIHQSSFKLIKHFFISPASIYATLFIKVGRKSPGGSPGEKS